MTIEQSIEDVSVNGEFLADVSVADRDSGRVVRRVVHVDRADDLDAFTAEIEETFGSEAAGAVRDRIDEAVKDRPRETSDEWEPTHLSQQVNAQRLVYELAGDARFNVSRGEWMVYREGEGRFVVDETGHVERAAKRVARRTWGFVTQRPPGIDPKVAFRHATDSEKASGIAAMMKLARTEEGISITAPQLDSDGSLLNVLNATIDLATGAPREHRREDLLSKLAPVRFDPAATCPLWESVIRRSMDGEEEKIGYLRRIAGLALASQQTVQELFIFWGAGANGKNVILDTLMGMLGDYAGLAPDSLLTFRAQAEHPTEIADICGDRLVVASETEHGAKLRVQLVKRLTGDATLKARFMRENYFEFPRTWTLILVSNNKPGIPEDTHAVWRRVRLLPFTVTIPEAERDPLLTEKLKAEWPGILNWCLAGYRDFLANGMQTPEVVKVATDDYRREQDSLAEYREERCLLGPELFVCRNQLYADYAGWVQAGETVLTRSDFYEQILRTSGVVDDQRRIGGRPTRGFTGIGLMNIASQFRQAQEAASERA